MAEPIGYTATGEPVLVDTEAFWASIRCTSAWDQPILIPRTKKHTWIGFQERVPDPSTLHETQVVLLASNAAYTESVRSVSMTITHHGGTVYSIALTLYAAIF
jgi:hypothetical protein